MAELLDYLKGISEFGFFVEVIGPKLVIGK